MTKKKSAHQRLTDAMPLSMYGDAIVEAYRKLGIEVVVSIHVGNLADGAVTGSTNLQPENEKHFLEWILEQRESGGFTIESQDYGPSDGKEKLN